MIDSIDCNKVELEKNLKKALKRLEREVLIQKDADKYYFLTNEEQDINREIDQEIIEEKSKYKRLDEYIFEDIFDENSITVEETGNKYQFNRMIDEERFGRPGGQLDLVILTPRADTYDKIAMIGSREEYDLIIKIPEEVDIFDEIETSLKVEEYLKKNRTNSRENIQKIIESKQRENSNRNKRIVHLLEDAIKESAVYIGGHEKDIKKKEPKKRIEEALKAVANFRFKSATLVKRKYDLKKIEGVLLTSFDSSNQLININKDLDSNPNREAITEVKNRIDIQKSRGNRLTVKDLVDYYSVKPYGWDKMTINGLLAELWVYKLINIEESGERISEPREAIKYLTKSQTKILEKLLIQPKEEIDIELLKKVNNIIKQFWRDVNDITIDNPKEEFMKIIGAKHGEVDRYIKECRKENLPGEKDLNEWKELLDEILNIRGNGAKVLKEFFKMEGDLEDIYDNYDRVKDFLNTQKKGIFIEGQKKIKEIHNYQDYVGEIKESKAYENLNIILEDKAPYNKIRLINDLILDIETQESNIISKEIETLNGKADKHLEEFKHLLKNRENLFIGATKKIELFKVNISNERSIQTLTKGKRLENIVNEIKKSYRDEIKRDLLTLKKETLVSIADKDGVDALEQSLENEFGRLAIDSSRSSIKNIETLVEIAKKEKEGFIKEAEGKAKKKERTSLHKLKVESAYNLESKEDINAYFEKLEREINQLKEKALKAAEEDKIVDIK